MSTAVTARKRADYGPIQLAADFLGIDRWQWETAQTLGLIPDPDVNGRRWSAEAADQLLDGLDQITAVVGQDPPIGARRSAERLAARTGLDVTAADIEHLADTGQLTRAGNYKGWPLYPTGQLDALDSTLVAEVMEHLGPDRMLGPNQAAEHLQVRRRDFDYLTAAGLVAPRRWVTRTVGWRILVDVPLYRVGDLDSLCAQEGIDWEEVRAVRPGAPSPLRRLAPLPETRATAVRRFVAQVGDRWDTEVYATYRPSARGGVWEIDWHRNPAGEPTAEQIHEMLDADPATSAYRDSIVVGTDAGDAVRWAQEMLVPDTAVILDTETTDLFGAIVEIAVIDAYTGAVLLDTLVQPDQPIEPQAVMIHGISDADVVDAPTWPEILPQLLAATKDRTVLAYNADYDHQVILNDSSRYGLDPGPLAHEDTWACVMGRRSDWLRTSRMLALGGGHRALDDTYSARDLLREMTQPA